MTSYLLRKLQTTPEFTLDSVRWCEMCGEDIRIGLGGELNWNRHINGAPHLKKASSKSADKTGAGKKTAKITAFFTPGAIPSSSRSARDSSVRGPAPLAPSVAAGGAFSLLSGIGSYSNIIEKAQNTSSSNLLAQKDKLLLRNVLRLR